MSLSHVVNDQVDVVSGECALWAGAENRAKTAALTVLFEGVNVLYKFTTEQSVVTREA